MYNTLHINCIWASLEFLNFNTKILKTKHFFIYETLKKTEDLIGQYIPVRHSLMDTMLQVNIPAIKSMKTNQWVYAEVMLLKIWSDLELYVDIKPLQF